MKPIALVLDRDAGTRKLLDVLLTRFGYDVDRIGVTEDAITLLDRIDYDFVLSDAEEVAAWLAQHREDALARMMILSSATEAQFARMNAEWKNVRIIRKPFELADVIDASQAAAANRPRRTPHAFEMFWRASAINGAKSGVLVRREGDAIALVTSYGYESGEIDRWFPLFVNDPYPICTAMRHGRPIWMASLTNTEEYPLLAAVWKQNHSRALAVVPVIRDGVVIGAAGWTFRDPQRFSETEQRSWTVIAQAAATLVEGDASAQPARQTGA
jgi:GAF domain-containing protein